MKLLRLFTLFITLAFYACGSSQKVISEDGEVYTVKNDNYFKNGKDVTATLESEEKEKLENTLKARVEQQKMNSDKLEKFEDNLSEIDKTIEQAEEKRETVSEQKEQFEERLEEKEAARQAVLEAKKEFNEAQLEYEKLNNSGLLSPNDKEKWTEKLNKLNKLVLEANQVYNTLK